MNERQLDELTALSAIYDGAVSWSTLPDGKSVEVCMKVEIDWEEDREVLVWDWEEPVKPTPTPREGRGQEVQTVTDGLGKMKVDDEGKREVAGGRGKRRKAGGRGRGGGGGAPNPPPSSDAASTTPFNRSSNRSQPSRPPSNPPLPLTPPPPPPKPRTAVVITLSSSKSSSPSGGAPSIVHLPLSPPITSPPLPTPPPPPAQVKPTSKKLKLRYLPSLEIRATLGEGYPESEGPRVVVRDEVGWLGEERRRQLEGKLGGVWTGDECLWMLYDLVGSSSLIDTLSLTFPLVLRQPASTSSASPLSTLLTSFDRTSKGATFAAGTYDCSLCLSTLKGRLCHSLACANSCTFCTSCLTSYFSLLITEGLVRGVCCPSEECTKERLEWEKTWAGKEGSEEAGERPGEVKEEEVRELVGEEMTNRWRRLREKQRWEADPSISFCPRPSCHTPVPAPPPSSSDSSSNLRVCPSPSCQYAFCQLCRATWHGSHSPCVLPASGAIVSAWLSAGEGSKERELLEKRYGKQNVLRLVRVSEEERVNREWLEERTKACSGCKAPVEKSAGCNHMLCTRCNAHFCFRCGYSLRGDPYQHFNTPGSSCYMKLFDFHDTVGGGELPAELIAEVQGEEARPVVADAPGEWEAMGEWHGERWNPFV